MASALIRFPAFSPVLSPMYSGRNVGVLYRLLASSQPTHYIYLVIDLLFIAGISSESIPALKEKKKDQPEGWPDLPIRTGSYR